jgi:predicted enzyme related to lactoylglutathione lyase
MISFHKIILIMKKKAVSWFEIPVSDMDRAIRFYETVFDIKLVRKSAGALDMALFPDIGSLVKYETFYKPSQDGVLIYLTAQSDDLATELGKVENAGGKVLLSKRQISEEMGYMGLFTDTEGNRIALLSLI